MKENDIFTSAESSLEAFNKAWEIVNIGEEVNDHFTDKTLTYLYNVLMPIIFYQDIDKLGACNLKKFITQFSSYVHDLNAVGREYDQVVECKTLFNLLCFVLEKNCLNEYYISEEFDDLYQIVNIHKGVEWN